MMSFWSKIALHNPPPLLNWLLLINNKNCVHIRAQIAKPLIVHTNDATNLATKLTIPCTTLP